MSSLVLQALRRQAQLSLPHALQPALKLSVLSLHEQLPAINGWHLLAPLVCTCPGQRRMFSSLNTQQVEQLRRDLSRPAKSLYFERPDALANATGLGKMFLNISMYWTEKNQAIIGGQVLHDAIKEQVDDGALCVAFGMDPKIFYSTYTLLAIHGWLIIQRLAACNGKSDRFFKQRFYNHLWADVEKRIYAAGVQVGVNKWLKKLESVFFSSGLSFDKVLRDDDSEDEGGDATGGASKRGTNRDVVSRMEKVVLREFFGGDESKTLQAELITRYLMHQMYCLKMTDETAIMKGNIQFSREPFARYRAQLDPGTPVASPTGQQSQAG